MTWQNELMKIKKPIETELIDSKLKNQIKVELYSILFECFDDVVTKFDFKNKLREQTLDKAAESFRRQFSVYTEHGLSQFANDVTKQVNTFLEKNVDKQVQDIVNKHFEKLRTDIMILVKEEIKIQKVK